jgi:hypothetical protein
MHMTATTCTGEGQGGREGKHTCSGVTIIIIIMQGEKAAASHYDYQALNIIPA